MEIRRKCDFTEDELLELKETAFVKEFTISHGSISIDMLYIVHPITRMTRRDD